MTISLHEEERSQIQEAFLDSLCRLPCPANQPHLSVRIQSRDSDPSKTFEALYNLLPVHLHILPCHGPTLPLSPRSQPAHLLLSRPGPCLNHAGHTPSICLVLSHSSDQNLCVISPGLSVLPMFTQGPLSTSILACFSWSGLLGSP